MRLPDDYFTYPGKMDHATACAIMAAGCMLPQAQGELRDTEYGALRSRFPQRVPTTGNNDSVYTTISGHAGRKAVGTGAAGGLTIQLFDMERGFLADISIGPNDLVTDTIYQVKHKLEKQIAGRAFRLRKGSSDWAVKPRPILKKDFGRRAVEVFAGEIVVVLEIAPPDAFNRNKPVSPRAGGASGNGAGQTAAAADTNGAD